VATLLVLHYKYSLMPFVLMIPRDIMFIYYFAFDSISCFQHLLCGAHLVNIYFLTMEIGNS
jgi:hypothetical protein